MKTTFYCDGLAYAKLTFAACCLLVVSSASAEQFDFSDDFEGTSLDPFWTIRSDAGTVTFPSSSLVHGGNQSVEFSSQMINGQDKYVALQHMLSGFGYGTISAWIYDTGADVSSSNYIAVSLANSALGKTRTVTTYDYDLGPGNSGSFYYAGPGDIATNIDRTLGWHEFSIETSATLSKFHVDGALVLEQAEDFPFDQISLSMSGPDWRPAWVSHFDDFSASVVPEPSVSGFVVMLALAVFRPARQALST